MGETTISKRREVWPWENTIYACWHNFPNTFHDFVDRLTMIANRHSLKYLGQISSCALNLHRSSPLFRPYLLPPTITPKVCNPFENVMVVNIIRDLMRTASVRKYSSCEKTVMSSSTSCLHCAFAGAAAGLLKCNSPTATFPVGTCYAAVVDGSGRGFSTNAED